MKFLVYFSRVFVGSLFIISGLIKANDPLGFSYKLGEYFAEAALNLPFLEPYALLLGMLACLAEIVLGFALIFGGKMKLASWALVGLTLFFGWLTLYTATCDPQETYTILVDGQEVTQQVACVTDCGCFGDAFKGSLGRTLTPWESFYKDLVLFIFLIPIFFAAVMGKGISLNTTKEDSFMLPLGLVGIGFFSWVFSWYFPLVFALVIYAAYLLIKRLMGERSDWAIAGMVSVISIFFMWFCYSYLPLKDYRPYAVGQNIVENMKSPSEMGLDPTVTYNIYTLVNEKTNKEMAIESDVYMAEKWWEKKEWKIDKDRTEGPIVRSYGYETPIPDFSILDADSYNREDTIIRNSRPVMLVLNYDVEKAGSAMVGMSKLAEQASKSGYDVFGLSASTFDDIEEFRHVHQLAFPYFNGDEKVIKTIARSNPAVVVIDQGTIKGKWANAEVPSFEEMDQVLQQ